MKAECRVREKQPIKGAGLIAEENDTGYIFMVETLLNLN